MATVRRWGTAGRLIEDYRTPRNHRRYAVTTIRSFLGIEPDRYSIGYARVSASDQRKDLHTQANRLSHHADRVITDLGSGMNCRKPGLRRLLDALLRREVSCLYLTEVDRLLRFGHELLFHVCRWAGTDVCVLDARQDIPFEQELCQDVLTLMTVFTARLYGKRAHKNRLAA